MAESNTLPISQDILKNNPVITLAGKPESGFPGRPIYLKDPKKYTIDGKPLTEFQLYGVGALEDTGVRSARINALVYKSKRLYYRDELLPNMTPGESILWNNIGAITLVDREGKKVTIPRNELRLTKSPDAKTLPGTKKKHIPSDQGKQPMVPDYYDEQFADGDMAIEPISSAPAEKTKPPKVDAPPVKVDAPPVAPAPKQETVSSQARYIDTDPVSRDTLEHDPHFQEVLTKMRGVLQEVKMLRKDLSDAHVLPMIAGQIRDVGLWSTPVKAADVSYQVLMTALRKAGLHADEALLASEYLIDQNKRQTNELAISDWQQRMQAKGDAKDVRRSVLDMVEHNGEGSVSFSKNAVEMSMTRQDRNAGYQDLRAAQITSDYLLDTYDSTARSRWVTNGQLTPEGMKERTQYHAFLSRVLQGQVPADKKELGAKLAGKLVELHRLSPDEAIAVYRGLLPTDKTGIVASVKRWREKHGVEPYRAADLDLMATKGLLLIERRSTHPELQETTDIFHKKALKESGTPTTKDVAPKTAEPPTGKPATTTEPKTEPKDNKTKTEVLPSAVKTKPPADETPDVTKKIKPDTTSTVTGEDEKDKPKKTEEPPTTAPKEVPKFEKVSASFVAVKGDIKHDQDVAAIEARLIARQAMEEEEKQYNPKGVKEWLSTTASRIWKHNWWEVAYASRERIHALLSQEKAGMEGIPLPLKYELRKKSLEEAKRRVEARQSASTHKNWERFKNWWSDAEGYFTQEHNESLTILGEWKAELSKLDDHAVPQAEKDRIMVSNPLYEARMASWNQSYKIADTIAKELNIHTIRGEQKFTETFLLAKDSPLGRRLLDEVAKPYWVGLDSHGSIGMTEAQAREKLDELFTSKDFTALLATLPADKQALLSSRSYANTILETFKGVHEQVRAATDHQDALKRLDFDIELTLGVAEYGARNKVEATFGEKRSKKNAELLKKLRNRDPLFSAAILEPAGHRAELLAEVANDALRNEMFWSVAISGGAMAAMRMTAGSVGKVLTPIGLGGLVGGAFGGYKEWTRLGAEHKLHNLETALGYAFPQTYEQRRFLFAGDVVSKKTRRGEMEQRSYHQRSMSELIGRMEAISMENGSLKSAITDTAQAKELMSLLIDTRARNLLSDRRDINLLKVSEADPTAPHVPFESQKRDLDRIAAQAKSLLGTSLASNQTLRDQLTTPLQAAGQTKPFTALFDELTELHYGALEKEAGILDTRYQTALGTLTVAQGQSMEKRDKDFKKFRIYQTAVVAGKTALLGAATGAALREAYGLAESVVQYNQTGQWAWHGPLSTGIGQLVDRFAPGRSGGLSGLAADAEVIRGISDTGKEAWGVLHFPQGIKMVNGNLVSDDSHGNIRILVFNFAPHFSNNGQITQETIDQLKGAGVVFDRAQAWTNVVSSGSTPLALGGHEYLVPKELHLVTDPGGNSSLVLEGLKDKAGNVIPRIVIMDHVTVVGGQIQNPDQVVDALNHHQWLDGAAAGHTGSPIADTIPNGIAHFTDAAGKTQDIHAMIPPGTHLVPSGGNSFNLVSDADANDVLLHKLVFDPKTGQFTNLGDSDIQKEIALHNLHATSAETNTPGSSGSFDLRAGYLDDKTKYMGPHGAWGWGERVLGKGGPQDNLFKNAFRAWHNWDGNNNADIAEKEVPGVLRTVPRVPGGLKMSDGTMGYQNSLNFNMGSDNLYIRNIPQSLFSDANITRIGHVMDGAIKEADAWKAMEIAAGRAPNINDVLDHLKAKDELSYLAYKHGYIGQYYTEGDWDRFRQLFEGPSSHFQTTISQGGTAWGVKNEVLENVLSFPGQTGGTTGPIPPFPVVPIIGRRPLEAPEIRKVTPVMPRPESTPSYPYGYEQYYQGNWKKLDFRIDKIISPLPVIDTQVLSNDTWNSSKDLLASKIRQKNLTNQTQTLTEADHKHILNELQTSIKNSDHVIFTLPVRIGDAVVAVGYLQAVQKELRRFPKSPKVSVIVPQYLYVALEPLADTNLTLIPGEESKGLETALTTLNPKENTTILDFEIHDRNLAQLTSIKFQDTDKNLTISTRLFDAALGGYHQKNDGDKRYSTFASDLLGTPPSSDVTLPTIPLFSEAERAYQEVCRREGINPAKPQVAINLEAGSAGRQYPVAQYMEVIKGINKSNPEIQINLLWDQNKKTGDPTKIERDTIENLIRKNGVKNVRIVSASLSEAIALLHNQKVVISGDTGLGHFTAAIPGGPQVITLLLPEFSKNWVSNGSRQIPLEPPIQPTGSPGGWDETDDAKKWIRLITPQEILDTYNSLTVPPTIKSAPTSPKATPSLTPAADAMANTRYGKVYKDLTTAQKLSIDLSVAKDKLDKSISAKFSKPKTPEPKATTPTPLTPHSPVPDWMNEFDPTFDKDERRSRLEQLIPPELTTDAEKAAWLVGHNKNVALSTFIQSERERLHDNGDRDWKSDAGWEKKWLTTSEMAEIAGKYKIPMAFMVRGAHAVVLTRPPERQSDGSYTVYHYNPYRDGEQTWSIKPELDTQGFGKTEDLIYFSQDMFPNSPHGTVNYENAIQILSSGNYDLRIPTIPGKEWLTKAKMALTQEDGFNCTLWSVFHAAIASAMKPGDSEFKRVGLPKFEEDTGLRILRYEDVAELTPIKPSGIIMEASASIANPNHAATNEDVMTHISFSKNNQKINRWLIVDGSGGSIPNTDPDRSEKVRVCAQNMASSITFSSQNNLKELLLTADKNGRSLPGYGTAIAADINEATGEVRIAHAGDAAALRWKPTPYASKRFYDPTSAPGNLQLITEQHNQAEQFRQFGTLKTLDLESSPLSSKVSRVIGDETKPEADVARGIVETNLTLNPDEYLILASDGARIGDMLTDGSPYQAELNFQMNRLHTGAITIEEATTNIAEAAKRQAEREGNDYDDITIVIAKRN